ncbi:MAG TPA: hypothetical protein VFZ34_31460 [Blastocatellia bacterium]|nr:hypothetical protein [Blastocatellia bacterium]
MPNKPLQIVRESLQTYAERGVFRGFSEGKPGQFTFVWFYQHPMELIVDPKAHALRFKQLLPGVPARSAFAAELKCFIAERQDEALPDHRRIDRKRAEVSLTNRGGVVSLALKVKRNDYAYGVNKLVNLVHELFVHLRAEYPEYLVENFDVPQE